MKYQVAFFFFYFKNFFGILNEAVCNQLFKKNYYYITVVLIFPLCPPPPSPTPTSTVNPHTVVCVHGSFIHVLWLVPSPSFHHVSLPLPSGHCQSVPCFHASGSILLIILFIRFLFRWDHMVFVVVFLKWNILKCIPWSL